MEMLPQANHAAESKPTRTSTHVICQSAARSRHDNTPCRVAIAATLLFLQTLPAHCLSLLCGGEFPACLSDG
ncbi:hypothetical protein VTN96DRAFT_165 [Rasamsonia emersonii]